MPTTDLAPKPPACHGTTTPPQGAQPPWHIDSAAASSVTPSGDCSHPPAGALWLYPDAPAPRRPFLLVAPVPALVAQRALHGGDARSCRNCEEGGHPSWCTHSPPGRPLTSSRVDDDTDRIDPARRSSHTPGRSPGSLLVPLPRGGAGSSSLGREPSRGPPAAVGSGSRPSARDLILASLAAGAGTVLVLLGLGYLLAVLGLPGIGR